jgi:maltose alpha-D-glucosyltransferase/alpha-amylase
VAKPSAPATVCGGEQSNTTLLYGSEYVCKLFRRIEVGPNPDLEVGRYLTEHAHFAHSPPVVGSLEHTAGDGGATSALAIVTRFSPHQEDAWSMTQHSLTRFFEGCLVLKPDSAQHLQAELAGLVRAPLMQAPHLGIPTAFSELCGVYPTLIHLLGKRTAELHGALGAPTEDDAFNPVPFTALHQRSLFESARTRLKRALDVLSRQRHGLPASVVADADEVLGSRREIERSLRRVVDVKTEVLRTRTHGDYHLGQVLYTGKDFVILDFEGEPGRSLAERRFKRCVLRDVAGMIRSLSYAAAYALTVSSRSMDVELLGPWGRAWFAAMSASFLDGYLTELKGAPLLPSDPADTAALLDFFVVEKCLDELTYELDNRPDWVGIPLGGLISILRDARRETL